MECVNKITEGCAAGWQGCKGFLARGTVKVQRKGSLQRRKGGGTVKETLVSVSKINVGQQNSMALGIV